MQWPRRTIRITSKPFRVAPAVLIPLEAAGRTDHALERAMIRFKDVIQIFRGAVYHIVRQKPFVLQAQDGLGIRRQFVGRDG